MAKRVSPAKVGAFVLGALLLVAFAIAILGGADLFHAKDRAVIYFDGSVKGLYIGSSVTFRGVEVGRVTRIGLHYDAPRNVTEVPVVVDLERDRMAGVSNTGSQGKDMLANMIQYGMRAQLAPDSLLANTEIIQLDFYPNTKADIRPNSTDYTEIPAIPSTLQQLQSEIEAAMQHLPALADSLNATVKGLNDIMSPANRQHMSAILANADTISTTIATHQEQIGDAMNRLDQTTQQLAGISTNLNQMLTEDRAPLNAAIRNIGDSAASLHKVSDQLDQMIAEDRAGLKQFSNGTLYQVGDLVVDTRRMIHRANDTLDELERNPSSFLFSQKNVGIPAK